MLQNKSSQERKNKTKVKILGVYTHQKSSFENDQKDLKSRQTICIKVYFNWDLDFYCCLPKFHEDWKKTSWHENL